MTTELFTTRQGNSLILHLSGPATRNALSPQVYAAGLELLHVAESDDSVCCVVLTGAGEHFCGGGDVQRLNHQRQHDLPTQSANIEAFHQWIEALRLFPKPVIAAVEGVAAGGGLSLALACDLLVASESARFVSAYSRLSLSPDGGLSWQLGRRIDPGEAMLWLLSGDERSPAQLQTWGLVHRVVPTGTALNAALELADVLGAAGAGVVTTVKELLGEAQQAPLGAQLQREKAAFMRNLVHPRAGQAMTAFLQRKKPGA